jgi:membrane protein
VSIVALTQRVWKSILADRVFGHAAELGFYFLFALFPTLLCGASIIGLVARSAPQISDKLLEYLSLVIPTAALTAVVNTFNQAESAATSGKLTFGTIAAVWSASAGVSAIQDTLNAVFKLEDHRSYFVARIYAILLTILLTLLVGSGLGCMFAGDFFAALTEHSLRERVVSVSSGVAIRIVAWAISACLLALSFAVLYYWAPDWKIHRWRWLSPGTILCLAGWLLASLGLRVYLHLFRSYTFAYGSLGAVIILLTWFYCSGLMLLVGAETDSVLDEAALGAEEKVERSVGPALE